MARKDLDEWLWQVGAELQKLSEEMTPQAPKLARRSGFQPAVDVVETDEHVVIHVEIAGLRENDVRIQYLAENQSLILRGVRREPKRPGRVQAAQQLEIIYGEFEREIRLPTSQMDIEAAEAEYSQGILCILVPKSNRPLQFTVHRVITVHRI